MFTDCLLFCHGLGDIIGSFLAIPEVILVISDVDSYMFWDFVMDDCEIFVCMNVEGISKFWCPRACAEGDILFVGPIESVIMASVQDHQSV